MKIYYKDTSGLQIPDNIYVVTSGDEWDSWDVSYHKTKKGAYKWIMQTKYQQWLEMRYLSKRDDYWYCVTEKPLSE